MGDIQVLGRPMKIEIAEYEKRHYESVLEWCNPDLAKRTRWENGRSGICPCPVGTQRDFTGANANTAGST